MKMIFITYQSDMELLTDHLSLLPVQVIHKESALPHGLRITVDGKVISYSGDTEWTETCAFDGMVLEI